MNETVTALASRWISGFDPETIWNEANAAGVSPAEASLREFIAETEQNTRQFAEFAAIAGFLNAQTDAEAAWEAFEAAASEHLEALVRATRAVALDWALDCIIDSYRRDGGNGIIEYLADIVREFRNIEDAASYLGSLVFFSALPGLIYRYDIENKADEWRAEIEAFLEEYREATGEPFSDEDSPPIKAAVLWFANELASRLKAMVD